MSTLAIGQIRKFTGGFANSLRIDAIGDDVCAVFGDCCWESDVQGANHHTHTAKELHADTVLLSQPIPEPAPELCAFPGCATKEHDGQLVHTAHVSPELAVSMCPCRGRRDHVDCHPFVAPQAKPVLREPMPLPSGLPDICLKCRGDKGPHRWMCSVCWIDLPADLAAGDAWDALHRKPAAKDIPSADGGMGDQSRRLVDTEAARGGGAAITKPRPPARFDLTLSERGPSAVAAAPAIEPWRPTVDDWDLLPDAETGWRR